MPKKRTPTYGQKLCSPAHPSLSSSRSKDVSHSLASSGTTSGNSVNDQIQRLRLSERPSSSSAEYGTSPQLLDQASNPSLPPSVRNALQLPDAPPPRPRPGLRVTRGRRGPAGPAAPQSWLTNSHERLRVKRQGDAVKGGQAGINVGSLPDAYFPQEGSLLATTLKAIARNWEWHKVYDQYYLATIQVRYKEALLNYLVRFGQHGIDRSGLEILFQDEHELENGTGAEGLTHLELATSIGNPLRLSDLKVLLSLKKTRIAKDDPVDVTPESWDDGEDLLRGPSGMGRFDTLTHLSLSHPNTAATWKGLLDVAPCLATITHLSLAYWPYPTLAPNSKTAYRETPQGTVSYGAASIYSAYERDMNEVVPILHRLSKSTYCLRWLDLEGCYPWNLALASKEIDWFGSWRALETVKISQGWLPECFQSDPDERAWRNVLFASDEVDPRNAGRAQLVEWAAVETESSHLETLANWNIATRQIVKDADDVDPQLQTVTEGQRAYWPNATALPSPSAEDGPRTARVNFERGWDSWWIADAIKEVYHSPAAVSYLSTRPKAIAHSDYF